MNTTKEKKEKKASRNSPKQAYSPPDTRILDAIHDAFPQISEKISIRHLWTDENVHRFRVNWRSKEGEQLIVRSEFVKVIEEGKELIVRTR
jgi:hypothetical protein